MMIHFSHISSYIIIYPLYILYIVHNYRAFLSSFWMAFGVKAEPGAGCKGGSFGADLRALGLPGSLVSEKI